MVGDDRISISEMARRLAVSRTSICRHICRLGVWRKGWSFNKSPHIARRRQQEVSNRKHHRATFRKAVEKHPELSLSQLKIQNAAAYAYLLRADAEWLRANSPKRRLSSSDIDWEKLDIRFTEVVEHAIAAQLKSQLESQHRRPERICISRIARWIGDPYIVPGYNRERMPRLSALLSSICEDKIQLGRRKLVWATQRFLDEGVLPSASELVDRVNIRPFRSSLAAEIEEALRLIAAGIR